MRERLSCSPLLPAFLIMGALAFVAGCAPDGAALFEREGCRRCHRFKGSGGSLAPDLTTVINTRSDDWIKRQIQEPSANSGQTRMPDYRHLSRSEINALLAYLKS